MVRKKNTSSDRCGVNANFKLCIPPGGRGRNAFTNEKGPIGFRAVDISLRKLKIKSKAESWNGHYNITLITIFIVVINVKKRTSTVQCRQLSKEQKNNTKMFQWNKISRHTSQD